eukprot:PLAT13702.2.p1 GENE.PLAT13702.2~~PLAT13702.2.p1  ORF type:complete len:160 (-),score=7.63 PLAT13702.2:295-774(-)
MGAARSKKALTRAVEEKDIKGMVACVGKLGKDVQVELKWFSLPLIAYCAHCDFVEGVTWLIEEGADVNALGENHTTALHRAKSAAVVNALLAAGADVDARNSVGALLQDASSHYRLSQLDRPRERRWTVLATATVNQLFQLCLQPVRQWILSMTTAGHR